MLTTSTAPPSVVNSWPPPNYVDPVVEGPALEIVGIVLGVIVVLLVTARLYSRIFLIKAPGTDDALATVAVVRLIPMGSVTVG